MSEIISRTTSHRATHTSYLEYIFGWMVTRWYESLFREGSFGPLSSWASSEASLIHSIASRHRPPNNPPKCSFYNYIGTTANMSENITTDDGGTFADILVEFADAIHSTQNIVGSIQTQVTQTANKITTVRRSVKME